MEINTPPKSSVSIMHRKSTKKKTKGKQKITADMTVAPTPKAKELLQRYSKSTISTNKGYTKFMEKQDEEMVDLMSCGKHFIPQNPIPNPFLHLS